MQEGNLHGFTGCFHRTALAHWRRQVLGHRLHYAIENQVDTDAGGKQHGRPGNDIEFRLRVIRSQLDAAIARTGDGNHKNQIRHHGNKVEPAEAAGNPGQSTVDGFIGLFGEQHGPQRKQHDAGGGTIEHKGIDAAFRNIGLGLG